MREQALIAAFLLIPVAAHAGEEAKLLRSDHVVVSYSGVGEEYAKAIATTVEAARAVAADRFGSDMPNEITVTLRSDPGARVRLFNDGQDRFELTVRSEKDLRRPARSGIFHLYGLCHEVGHLAMYRVVRDHSWMTTAAAEGWAHYLGSRIVDGVYAREGDDLWPDAYDYRADGMARLRRQLAAKDPSPIVRGASLWKELTEIIGDKGVAPIFSAWGKEKIDPTDPGAALRKALLAANKDKRLAAWWDKAEPLMVVKRPKSGFADRKAKPGDLTGEPIEHARDDGAAAGAGSIAGSAHAVRFSVQGDSGYLTGVRIHGSRYGSPRPPREDIHVWLCDKDHKAVADFPFPYATFARGPAEWV
ncbi:MAG TPA: hypothetical protein VM389_01755, partial [Phycisphaerae bacterium]|nr:hypothetical protein [Phycisphaerae bacterium]